MADLTDLTITPMIPIGIGVSIFVGHQTTGWSFPIATVIGFIVGPILGFCVGMLLTGMIVLLVDMFCNIQENWGDKKVGHKDTS